ncbi:alpha/beta hydrolase [Inquilinus limosus]|uniref:alpha/beta hydrolase n=1 Tax=Inquilinus limosus TaxID=171674 RepID=UPI003F18EDA0
MTSITDTPAAEIAVEDLMIPSDTPGIRLHVRNKRPAAMRTFSPERTIVLMHGATYSSGTLFDVPVGGFSFMDYLAGRGYDVHAVDVRGYGGSTKPPEMEQPPEENPPLGRTEAGIRDLSAAVDFVLERRGLKRTNIVAMSWGGSVAGAYTARNNAKVAKLALVAPQWLNPGPARIDPGWPLGAYRRIPVLQGKARWLEGAPADRRDGLIPEGWFESWAEAALATDPEGASQVPPTMRAVTGPILDTREYWSAGRPFYDPGDIAVPVLLVHAEWDLDVPLGVAQAYFTSLTGAPYRRWVEIGEGTHMVLMEKNRLQAFRAVADFLDEDYAPEG